MSSGGFNLFLLCWTLALSWGFLGFLFFLPAPEVGFAAEQRCCRETEAGGSQRVKRYCELGRRDVAELSVILWCYFIVCTFNSQSVFFPNGSECFGPCFGHSQDPLLCSCLKPGTCPASLWTNPGVSGGCSVLEDRVTPKTDRPQNCCGASGIFQLWVLCSREGSCVNP